MKQMVFSFLVSSVVAVSCTVGKKDVIGKYSYKGDQVVDSLILKDDVYIHKIFDKNSQLMYEGRDKWVLEKDRITLFGFYNNENSSLEEPLSNEDAKKFVMIVSFPVFKQDKDVIIEVNSDENILYKMNK
ncbi:hypothetical protein RAH57_09035 [Chryseobacterium sp. CKR4-1]|uniref:hypothetical protein n=1 Tax=Chryseobacterium sp. CKR4-1 TaxID=3068896 RepID=UPI002796915E|nr:hypothetical protein [Chryseobacterium sp. CKR4-1]MDQ1804131.1 hypothetical protein [Chryseobacterium sp. CKR4-1]